MKWLVMLALCAACHREPTCQTSCACVGAQARIAISPYCTDAELNGRYIDWCKESCTPKK